MILAETSLSFLGLGLQPPIVSWGVLLQEAQNVRAIATAPWLFAPGVAVVIAVLSLNFLGDGLRDAADPYGHDHEARRSPTRPSCRCAICAPISRRVASRSRPSTVSASISRAAASTLCVVGESGCGKTRDGALDPADRRQAGRDRRRARS